MELKDIINVYRGNKPLRVRIWNEKTWRVSAEYFVNDGKLTDNNGAVVYDNPDALNNYYVCTFSVYDYETPTANLVAKW